MAGETVSVEQQHQHRGKHECSRECTHHLHKLLFPRGGLDDVSCLQILHVVAGDGGSAADDRADNNGGGGTVLGAFSHKQEQ